MQIPKNNLKNFVLGGRLREHKNICKNVGEKRKYFAKTKTFRENHPRKASEFSIFSKIEKGVFV
jgi:hypothetical protein